jgi:hypothetical protein
MKDPRYRKDKMNNPLNPFRPSEVRVEDDEGTMRRRNGDGCCGCGKWETTTFSQKPVWTHHDDDDHHHDGDHGDGPKLLWGLF